MKKLIIILLIIFIGLSISCTRNIDTTETIVITETSIITQTIEDTQRIDELEAELEKYQDLIGNLNELLKNVYKGNAENSNWKADEFTGFSIKYKDKFYLITAGHCVHYNYAGTDTGVFTNFSFKANFSDKTIYPKLLTYENDFTNNRDYAILYSDKIKDGLDIDLIQTSPEYILGNENNNVFKEFTLYNLLDGESGSPVIDIDGQVISIATGNFVDIDLVLEAIDNLK
jgi:hypothetical protein